MLIMLREISAWARLQNQMLRVQMLRDETKLAMQLTNQFSIITGFGSKDLYEKQVLKKDIAIV